jgi:protein-tyrosine kinase
MLNKLEQAIRKTVGDGYLRSSSSVRSSFIEEIDGMKTSYLMARDDLCKNKIICPDFKDRKLVNSFRELRTSLTAQSSNNVVMVTSIGHNSGVSFFSRNLAAAVAFDVAKTSMLVDCSGVKNNLNAVFKLDSKLGLSDFIYDKQVKVEDIIHESGLKRLRILPFGRPGNGGDETFSHPRFHGLISEIKNKYSDRYIIVDAPPILKSADARILMEACDQVLLVVRYGCDTNQCIEAAAKMIGSQKFAGVVFNEFLV